MSILLFHLSQYELLGDGFDSLSLSIACSQDASGDAKLSNKYLHLAVFQVKIGAFHGI